jgi:hypothetical protein
MDGPDCATWRSLGRQHTHATPHVCSSTGARTSAQRQRVGACARAARQERRQRSVRWTTATHELDLQRRLQSSLILCTPVKPTVGVSGHELPTVTLPATTWRSLMVPYLFLPLVLHYKRTYTPSLPSHLYLLYSHLLPSSSKPTNAPLELVLKLPRHLLV